MTPHPPAWLAALLQRALPHARADEILGDLHEEFTRVAARHGTWTARLWYAIQAAGLVVRLRSLPRERPALQPMNSNSGDPMIGTLVTEARHAVRSLVRRPSLAMVVVLTLSLGLAANAAIFQVIDALVLRPFTLSDVDRLVMLSETGQDIGEEFRETVAPAMFRDWKTDLEALERIAAFAWWDVNVSSGDDAERVIGIQVSADFFGVLGVEPAPGRGFTADEETPGRNDRVVLSHGFWQRRYAGDPRMLGRTILLDGKPVEVVGVMPESFAFPPEAELWAPLALSPEAAALRDQRYLSVIGRLASGRSLRDADAQVKVTAARVAQEFPETNKDRSARAVSVLHGMRDTGLGPIIVMWQASALLVLLIACANVANLLLARGAEREREIAVRSALGASRGRIVRGLLLESAGLALAAVPVALAFAWLALHLIRVNMPPRIVRFVAGWQAMDVDGRLVGFTVALATVTAVVFGLVPALRASRPLLAGALKEGGRGATAGHERQRLRRLLVIGQIALALPLLVAAAVSTASAHRFLKGAQGYDPDGLLVMRVILPQVDYLEPDARRRFAEDALRRLEALPGVRSVGLANVMPTMGGNTIRTIEVEGRPNPDAANPPAVDFRAAAPGFLSTMGIPVLQGRGFTPADSAEAQQVVVISRSAADRHFPDMDPIGRRLKLGDSPWLTVVGVSGDVIHNWFARRHAPTAYRPFAQSPTTSLGLAIRTEADPTGLVLPARAAIRAVDSAQAAFDIMPMTEALHERTIGLQYVAAIMAVFGALALILAVVGVYGLMAVIISQRTHEIGVRIALGASRGDVLRVTIGHAARLTALGVAVGFIASLVVGRTLEAVLVGVLQTDVRLSLAVAGILTASAILAGYVPARRAARIDPISALKG